MMGLTWNRRRIWKCLFCACLVVGVSSAILFRPCCRPSPTVKFFPPSVNLTREAPVVEVRFSIWPADLNEGDDYSWAYDDGLIVRPIGEKRFYVRCEASLFDAPMQEPLYVVAVSLESRKVMSRLPVNIVGKATSP